MTDAFAKAVSDLVGHLIARAATAGAERLIARAARDEVLRTDLRRVAEALLAATVETPTAHEAEPGPISATGGAVPAENGTGSPPPPPPDVETAAPVVSPPPVSAPHEPTSPVRSRPVEPLPELLLGRTRPAEGEAWTAPTTIAKTMTPDSDLVTIEARCRLKAEGVRWAATRHRLIAEGSDYRAEVAPTDREIVDRAKALPDCYLWMNSPDFSPPREPALMEDVAGCFEAVADAVALVRGMLEEVESHGETFEQALDLMAEAQSALRVAIGWVDGPSRDMDQFRVYDWLRGTAERERIYIRRHMRLEDPADPARLPAIRERINALGTRLQETRDRVKRRKSRLKRLAYHARLIGEGTGGDYDWRKVAEVVDEMVGDGVPSSSVEIREALLPILDGMPDLGDLPHGFGMALREIDRFLETRSASPVAQAPSGPTAEVREVARLLAGKSVVLIGGSRRPGAEEALRAAFDLKDLIWVGTREHMSIEGFEPAVARPDVAAVLLAIRWSSHSFGDVKRFCDRHGKPLVRLPAGYSPNQIATQILAQCSDQLGSG